MSENRLRKTREKQGAPTPSLTPVLIKTPYRFPQHIKQFINKTIAQKNIKLIPKEYQNETKIDTPNHQGSTLKVYEHHQKQCFSDEYKHVNSLFCRLRARTERYQQKHQTLYSNPSQYRWISMQNLGPKMWCNIDGTNVKMDANIFQTHSKPDKKWDRKKVRKLIPKQWSPPLRQANIVPSRTARRVI